MGVIAVTIDAGDDIYFLYNTLLWCVRLCVCVVGVGGVSDCMCVCVC